MAGTVERMIGRRAFLNGLAGAESLVAEGTDWRFLNELKKELKG